MANFNYLFVLISLAFIISSGIHIFSRGFLLTRTARTEKRVCEKFLISNGNSQCLSDDKKTCNGETLDEYSNINSTAHRICFQRKSKVVVLLIDALKYDFGIYDENITNPLAYQNKLPILRDLMQMYPDQTRLLKFLADPPTTTLQRLKGMTTGSLPTFIDMGSNFATPEINEDNVIDQIFMNNLTAVFMGDSTWTELFPKRFKRKYAYPSFNIHDLDTVDTAILKHLPDELKKTDWDILIAHFLGVDHAGHKHGPLHPEMSRKLKEMNDVIAQLSKTIDDDTVLVVMGDHGMTVTGDHGGASEDETVALFFAFSKQKRFISTRFDENVDFIQQIDFAPTLATILGVPVPFSNLGTLNLQLLPDVNVIGFKKHRLLLAHLWHNAKQIQNYFLKYSEENQKTFSYDDFDEFGTKFEVFEHRVNSISNDEAFMSFSTDLKNYLDHLLELCRNIWIKFNPQLMTQGMLLVFLGIFTAFILVYNVPLAEFPKVFRKNIINFSMVSTAAVGILTYVLGPELGLENQLLSSLFISATWNILVLGFIIIQNWGMISNEMSTTKMLINVVPRICYTFSALVFFSNSFIVHEQKILCYLLSACVIYAVYELRRATKILEFRGRMKWNIVAKSTFLKIVMTAVGLVILLRLSQNYFKCREEQGDCWDFLTNSESSKKSGKMDFMPTIALAIFVTIVRIYLKTSGNLTGFSLHVLVSKFGPTLSVIAACGYMILSQNEMKRALVPQIHLDTLAWVVYGVCFLELLVIGISPLMIYVVPRTNDQFRVSNYGNAIPELFRHVKGIFNQGTVGRSGQIPIIYGFATVYSSVFLAICSTFGIMLALLLGVKVSNGFIITIAVGFGILFVFSVLRYESTDNAKECLQPHFSLVVTWFLLVNYGFYATSHQPTISQIDWNAAFVGRTANFNHSNLVSAVLVLISTFNSNFLFLIIYPLVVLFPFMIYAVYPQLSMKIFSMDKKSKEEKTSDYRKITLNNANDESETVDFDVTRGEINLYENEELFMASVFKVGCQLMILQGMKVLASMIACTILCRHLMVWKIFAPRFIYEGIGSYISFIAIILGFLLLMRIHVSVKTLVDKINKKS